MDNINYSQDYPVLSDSAGFRKILPCKKSASNLMPGGTGVKGTHSLRYEDKIDIKSLNAQNGIVTGRMINVANDCFNNTIINGLANTPLRQIVMNKQANPGSVTSMLQDIFREMEEGIPAHNINTRLLRVQLGEYNNRRQHDIFDFLRDFLAKLVEEEEANEIAFQNDNSTLPEFQQIYQNYIGGSDIRKLFTWLIEKPFTCTHCGQKKVEYETQIFYKLYFPEGEGPFNISDCIQYTGSRPTDENYQYRCDSCNLTSEETIKIEVIKIAPPVPIFQLAGRAGYQDNTYVKNETIIEFEEEIELNNEVIPIKSVLNHHGLNSYTGHYTSYIKGSRSWISTNDTLVTPIAEIQLNMVESYGFIYSKVENSVRLLADTLARDVNRSMQTNNAQAEDINLTDVDEEIQTVIDVDNLLDDEQDISGRKPENFVDPLNRQTPSPGGDEINEKVVINLQQHSQDYKLIHIDGDGHCLFNSIGCSLCKKLPQYEVRKKIYLTALGNAKFYGGLTNNYTGYGETENDFSKKMSENLDCLKHSPPVWGSIIDIIMATQAFNIDIYSYNSQKNDITAYSAKKGKLHLSNFIVLHYDGAQHYEVIKMHTGKRPLVKHFFSFAANKKKPGKGRMYEYKIINGNFVLQDLATRRENAHSAGESVGSMNEEGSKITTKNKVDVHTCEKCQKTFKQKKQLTRHLKTHNTTHNTIFKCEKCSTSFSRADALKRHLKTHDNSEKYKCEKCNSTFSREENLKRHLKTHENTVIFKCEKCNSTFSREDKLNIHLKTHENTDIFKCEKCNTSCSNEENLKRHLKTHDNPDIFICEKCNSTFSREDTLKIHLKTHENPDIFKCEKCNTSCSNEENLKRHLKTHDNPDIFICEKCNSTFSREEHLKRHIKTHENSEKYKCDKCNSSFTRKDNLMAHYNCHNRILDKKRREDQVRRKQKSRKHENSFEHFFKAIQYGPIFICVCCHQKHFECNVHEFNDDLIADIEIKFPTLFDDAIVDDEIWVKGEYIRRMDHLKVDKDLCRNVSNPQNYICRTCTKYLKKAKVPPMSYKNGLEMYKYEEDEEEKLKLSEVASMLIAKNAIFQKLYLLPKSRWSAVKDRLINVPIPAEVTQETIDSLPKLPTKAGLTAIKFKRKKEYKHGHRQEYINPQQLIEAVKILIKKHPEYKDIKLINNYVDILSKEDPEVHANLFCSSDLSNEEVSDEKSTTHDNVQDETIQEKIENILNLEQQEILDELEEEEDYHKKNDPVKKFQFEYNENVVLTERHPGAFDNIGASNSENTTKEKNNDESPYIDFAPAEGQTPTNILSDDKWDIKTFPLLYADGKGGLRQDRKRKLNDTQYFQQRILNYDERFAKNPSYLFAATQYVEQKQLQRNVGLSFTRGKKGQAPDGASTYSLDDGYSVLDNISNTPRYWSKARQEFIARLENEGAFQFFNTQSCADLRWDENFTSLLRKDANIKIIVDKSTQEDDLDFDEIFVQNTNKEDPWKDKDGNIIKKRTKDGKTELLSEGQKLIEPQEVPLQYYLDNHLLLDKTKHETIRKSVLNATRNFNHKVKAFYRHIIKGSDNRMSIGFYTYRIEFQDRGAGHVHGVLWIDWDAFEKNEANIEDFADENEEEIGNGVKKLRTAFKKFKDEEALSVGEYEKIVKFNDTFISCSTNATVVENMLHRIKLKKNIKSDESTDNDMNKPKREERDDDKNNSMEDPPSWTGAEDDDNNEPIESKQKIFTKTRKSPKEKGLPTSSNAQTQESKEDALKSKKKKVAEHITKKIVEKVQIHHHTKSCKKYGTNCRFSYPKFPTKDTILAIPVDKLIKYIEDEDWSPKDDDQENINVLKELFQNLKNLDEDERKDFLNNYKDILKSVKEVLNEEMKNKDTFDNLSIDDILQKAGTTLDEYRRALSISFSGGYKIIHKREVEDVMVNNYNPEFIYAWDGNCDLQMCPDYYSVISYIANYVSKDDSATMEHLKEAAKHMGKETLINKLIMIKNVFLKYRQMGEAEAIYRLLPGLHFKESNLATKFAPTGFRENRSKFLQRIDEDNHDNEYMASGREKIYVSGKDGTYVEKPSVIDKYERRPLVDKDGDEHPLRHLCLAQFIREYDPANKKTKNKKENSENEDLSSENDSDMSDDESEDNDEKRFIKTCHSDEGDDKKYLPKFIKLTSTYPGEPKYMKRRTHPAALRYHKFRKDNHEYFYSEILLYRPFTEESNPISEGGLLECQTDLERCIDEFEKRSNETAPLMTDTDDSDDENESTDKPPTDLEIVKLKVMPHLQNVEEGRLRAQESKQIHENVGETIDPENEQENDDLEDEGLIEDPDHLALHPGELESQGNNGDQSIGKDAKQSGQSYRTVELITDEEIYTRTRSLDPEQRMVVDIAIKYAKDIVKSSASKSQIPEPPRLIIQGGAGSGKSTVINLMSQWVERILRKAGDDPSMPYIIKAAYTGSAANVIDGQTVHSAFSFPVIKSNEYYQLSDKVADEKRISLKNLKMVIIDEMSLLSADFLYKLNLRLQEITMRKELFGNCAIFYLGDLLQLPPVRATFVFDRPRSKAFQTDFDMAPIWWELDSISLVTNHRQGDDKTYASLLNRMRKGELTNDDLKLLQTRVFPEKHPDIPKDALNIQCTNKEVNKINEEKMKENSNPEVTIKAINIQSTKKKYKPKILDGKVGATSLLNTLTLKIGCEVMLTYNVDVCDGLVNGSRGTILDFIKFPNGEIQYIIVGFHDEKAGRERRKQFANLQLKYPNKRPVPIERVDLSYSLSKQQNSETASAKILQFPLTLGSSCTGHRAQGLTVAKPNTLVTDLRKSFIPSLCYVICSRIQCLEQLFIIEGLPKGKTGFNCIPLALDEVNILDEISINKNPSIWNKADSNLLKISCLNIRSLAKHFEDLKQDFTLLKSNIIILTETWIHSGTNSDMFQLDKYYSPIMNSVGRGKGIGIYYDNQKFSFDCNANNENFQITKIKSQNLDIIGVYRSQTGDKKLLVLELIKIVSKEKDTLILGDFNINYLKEETNTISAKLAMLGFKQLVKLPTHELGSLLDHAYYRASDPKKLKKIELLIHSLYYSDHDAILIAMSEMNDSQQIESLAEQRKRKRVLFKDAGLAAKAADYSYRTVQKAFSTIQNAESEAEAREAFATIETGANNAVISAEFATNTAEQMKCASRLAKVANEAAENATNLFSNAIEILAGFEAKQTVSPSKKRKTTKEQTLSEKTKKRKLSLNKKRKAGTDPEGNFAPKATKLNDITVHIGCPVCKDGEEFEGGHQCIICNRMVHSFCASSKEEGFGKKVTCNDCNKSQHH